MATISVYSGKMRALLITSSTSSPQFSGPTWIPQETSRSLSYGSPFSVSSSVDIRTYDASQYEPGYHESFRIKDNEGVEYYLGFYVSTNSNPLKRSIRPAYKRGDEWRSAGSYGYGSRYGSWIPMVVNMFNGGPGPMFAWAYDAYQSSDRYANCTLTEYITALTQAIQEAKDSVSGVSAISISGVSQETGSSYWILAGPAVGYGLSYYGSGWYSIDEELKTLEGGRLELSPTSFYYDGDEHLPTATVYDADGNILLYGTDWGISYSPDHTNIGQKIALAYGQGEYTGELTANWWIIEGDSDPYMPGGETVPSTGPTDGTWTLPEDEIAPTGTIFSDLDAQLYRPYAMTAAQVASFSNQLWNTSILDIISRYFEKPTDVVISLMSYPFEVQSTETASQISFNWISDWSSVYVTGHVITQELQTLDFGYIDIDRYSGTFYDYQPYSSVQLYLPYIGFVPLKMNEIIGRRLYLKYIVDVITGDFSAIIETSWPDQSHGDETTIPIIATYQGSLAKALPLSQQDMFNIYKKGAEIAITGAIAATAGIASYGAAAEAREASVAAQSFEEAGANLASTMAEQRSYIAAQQSRTMLRTAKRAAAATGVNTMYAVSHANTPIVRSGNLDGIAGRTSMQEAFVIISVPDQNVSGNQGILGYPTNLPGPLENYAGYTEVRDIRIKSAAATESEIAEIEEIVRGGIII